jgi:hypothetical protein
MRPQDEVSVKKRLRVTQTFVAKLVASRRCERFEAGELLTVIETSEESLHSRFMRINGLRPSRGVECMYIIESGELKEKTEIVRVSTMNQPAGIIGMRE